MSHENQDVTVQAAENLSPPTVSGVALPSAIEFFKGAYEGRLIEKPVVGHGVWFIYTVNGVRPDNVAVALPALDTTDIKELARRGQEMAERMQGQVGTAAALNFFAILQLVQMIMEILRQLPRFKNDEGNGNGGIVI